MKPSDRAPNERGRIVLVTGGTAGIGFTTARALLRAGHEVVITGRDARKGEEAVSKLRRHAHGSKVTFLAADHSTVGANLELAAQVRSSFPHLAVLVNNVGGLFETRWETDDGYEATLAMNLVGPFTLSQALLPLLELNGPARCINVVSAGFKMHHGDPFADVQSSIEFVGSDAYAKTKLLNLLVVLADARRHDPAVVTVNAVHPGMSWTPMTQAMTPRTMPVNRLLWPVLRLLQRTASPERAGRRVARLVTDDAFAHVTGAYFEGGRTPSRLSARELDPTTQDRAWEMAAELVSQAAAAGGEPLAVDPRPGDI